MRTKITLLALAVAAIGLLASDVAAAPGESLVVSACGNQNYNAGVSRPDTINTDGEKCISGAFSAELAVDGVTSTQTTGTIAVTDTFQSIQVATSGRKGCLIQNTYTNSRPLYVFFGPIADATKAKSFILDANHGLAINCSVGGLAVITSQISITGTATDAFSVGLQ